jgi:CubicO group peptidase (beta-lactamase class C family)
MRIKFIAAVLLLLQFIGSGPALAAANEAIDEARVTRAVQDVDKLAEQVIAGKGVVGLAIAVVFRDKIIFSKGYGLREVGKPEAVDANTVFQLASVSKPVASTVVAGLIGKGKVTWDSKISDLDPAFEMHDPWVTREITVRDFFAHRSGLPEHSGDLLEDIGYDRAQVLHRLRYQIPDSSFRAHYAYTNFGLTEAAVAAAKANGLSWEDASDQTLYKPLGMTSTSSRFADFMARPNKALNHVLVDGKWTHKYQRDPDAQSPAGGVSSNVLDLAKWMRLQIADGQFEGKQIINKEALAATHEPVMLTQFSPLSGLPGFYGLGWNVAYDEHGNLRLGHSGGFAMGAATCVTIMPKQQLGIMVLTNGEPIGVPEGLAASFFDSALYGKQERDWLALFKKVFSNPEMVGIEVGYDYSKPPKAPSAAENSAAYLGTYSNDFFGDIEIVSEGDALTMLLGPKKEKRRLKHYDRDTFLYETEGENASGVGGVTFRIAATGTADSAFVEHLNRDGQGVFTRKTK